MHHIPSPDTSDSAIEREIQAKGLTAARVTPQDLEDSIASEHFFTGENGTYGAAAFMSSSDTPVENVSHICPPPLVLLTFCVLVLKNGFTVTGESACASPANFDAADGRKIARANAVNKLWPLLGFRLRQALYEHEDRQEQLEHQEETTRGHG